jgi:hypothetical protein
MEDGRPSHPVLAGRRSRRAQNYVIAVLLIACAFAVRIYFSRSSAASYTMVPHGHFTCPADPTREQLMEAAEAIVNNRPLPDGWTYQVAAAPSGDGR